MDIQNKHEVYLTLEQLESLVTLLRKEGASGDDTVWLTKLYTRGVYATHLPVDAASYSEVAYYHAYRGDTFYKCHDCRKCKHSDIEGDDVRCHLNDAYVPPICVGFANDDLVPSCSEYEEVTHE